MKQAIVILTVIVFCKTLLLAQAPMWEWSISAGGGGSDKGIDIVTDQSGNVYVVGRFQGSPITFDSITLTNIGDWDIFIAKYNQSGNVIWANNIGGNKTDEIRGIVSDMLGNIYIVGNFLSDTIYFGNNYVVNKGLSGDIFIAKYGENGNVLWVKGEGGNNNDVSEKIAIDTNGKLYVTGYFSSDSMTIGNFILTNSGNQFSEIFIAQYDSLGNVLWAKTIVGDYNENVSDIALTKNDNLYIAGNFKSDTIFFGNSINVYHDTTNNTNQFIAKYDLFGNVVSAKRIDGLGYFTSSITTDTIGNLFLTGAFTLPFIIVGNDTLFNTGDSDVYIAKFDSVLNPIWKASLIGNKEDDALDIVADISGDIYVTGYFSSDTLIADDSILIPIGGYPDIFFLKYNSFGDLLWAENIGNNLYARCYGIAADLVGNIYVTGEFRQTLVFGNDSIVSVSAGDVFIAKLSNPTTSIKETSAENRIIIYPNPTNSNFIVTLPSATKQLTITNTMGQVVQTQTINKETLQFHIALAEKGTYFIHVTTEEATITKKVIVMQ